MTRAHLIGIAGRSGAGKTTLARALARSLDEPESSIISLDSYYRDLSNLEPLDRGGHNFDHPDAIDWQLFTTHLRALRTGGSISIPVYDFRTHRRVADRIAVTPGRFTFVEGVLALYLAAVRTVLDTKIFITLDSQTCLERRTQRDMHERGRTRLAVSKRYVRHVEPMFSRFARPTRQFADFVVRGDQSSHRVAGDLHQKITARLADVDVPDPV